MSLLLLFACESGGTGDSSGNKPKARGSLGEILLVIDSAKYAGPVGDALKEVFEASIPGIIRDESMFYTRKVDPRKLTRILKMANNMVYVTTFDDQNPGSRTINNQFTAESIEMSRTDSSLFMLRNNDEFAIGQEVLYLFGENEEELIKNLKTNKTQLQNLFINRERERLGRALFNRKNGEASLKSQEKFGISLNLPASYQLAMEEEKFLWYRQPTPTPEKPDISLFFYQTDYTDEAQLFPENIIQFRNEITKSRIYGDPAKKESYIVTETLVPPVFKNTQIDGKYSVEMRGAWKTNNLSMGGSFLSYTIVDERQGKIFYAEGFVYYPNEAHRSSLREIETILNATSFEEAVEEN
ncbi:protein of unknown function [Cyclobacterium lianum]|uniref:DUF4837 domain-containing protein n=1 Tax=Cyclobacterium lianum TaxID=388280 RepID=A0A1M7PWQ1_9BACT|nr:DUF4837 family protein [Cyclobacterium lianum]SHN22014.1 protein of unknown function [Cyclobacterium lianum]